MRNRDLEGFDLRKVLSIAATLIIAAIILSPALGYTNQAVGNQSYSAKSGNHVEYSFKTLNVPAHNLTPDMVTNKYSFKSPAVQSTRMPYSFQQGTVTPYSLKLEGVKDATPLGMKTKPAVKLGSMNKPVAVPVVEPVAELAGEPVTNTENATAAIRDLGGNDFFLVFDEPNLNSSRNLTFK
ncbi:MAG: hypothetical protein NTU95_08870 [Methanothrix sp.]|nr:hypothetical protein [Methanothrix sp.]